MSVTAEVKQTIIADNARDPKDTGSLYGADGESAQGIKGMDPVSGRLLRRPSGRTR